MNSSMLRLHEEPKLASFGDVVIQKQVGRPRYARRGKLGRPYLLSLLFLALTLSACGKRSTPEPAYEVPPYKTEKPTTINGA